MILVILNLSHPLFSFITSSFMFCVGFSVWGPKSSTQGERKPPFLLGRSTEIRQSGLPARLCRIWSEARTVEKLAVGQIRECWVWVLHVITRVHQEPLTGCSLNSRAGAGVADQEGGTGATEKGGWELGHLWTCCILRFWKGSVILIIFLMLLMLCPLCFPLSSSFVSLSLPRLPSPPPPRRCIRLRWHPVVQPSSSRTLVQGQVRTSEFTSSDLFSLPSQRPSVCEINSVSIAQRHHVGAHRWHLETLTDKHNNWNNN